MATHAYSLVWQGYMFVGEVGEGSDIGRFTCEELMGTEYTGQFKAGKFYRGTLRYPDGGSYSGEWVNDKRTGYGVEAYASNSTYSGQWLDDERHGFAEYKLVNGDVYRGQWASGKQHGRGRWITAKGSEVKDTEFDKSNPGKLCGVADVLTRVDDGQCGPRG